jgi:uncharacterized protein
VKDRVLRQDRVLLEAVKTSLHRRLGSALADVVVYGSRARGDAAAESDYDILVVLNDRADAQAAREAVRDDLYSLCWMWDVVIQCHFVSVQRYRHEASPYLMNVRREGVHV